MDFNHHHLLSLRYWFVEHPVVRDFEWREGQTWGSSNMFLLTALTAYLSLTAFLTTTTTPLLLPSSRSLRLFSTVHNLFLVILSSTMAIGGILSSTYQLPSYRWIFCFPKEPNTPTPRGPIFFWAYVFYLSKYYEFVDTLLIVLNQSSNKNRLSFLHVYHHAVMVTMCYLWISKSTSLLPLGIITNSLVHVLMYTYYLLCSFGRRPAWKRSVTDCQIIQFVFAFGVSGVMLWFHFTGEGCSGFKHWFLALLFNTSLLVLFTDFRRKNYAKNK